MAASSCPRSPGDPRDSTQESTHDLVVWTPFHRTIPDVKTVGWVEEPDFSYTSYDVFVLNTRITAWLSKNWDSHLSLKFPSKMKNNSMYMTLVPMYGDVEYSVSETKVQQLQQVVDDLTSRPLRAVLLMILNPIVNEEVTIPSSWLRSAVPYSGISPEVNPHLTEEGLLVELGDYLDYRKVYTELLIKVRNRLIEMYTQGYIINPSPEIVAKWRLSSVDDHLYVADWNDARITSKYGGIQGFIQSRQSGDQFIDFYTGPNWVSKHDLAKYLQDQNVGGEFSDQHVRIPVDDIEQAEAIASHIDIKISESNGMVLNMAVSRPSWLRLYTAIADKLEYSDSVGYLSSDPDHPYIFSCKVPAGTNISEVTRKINVTATEIVSRLEDAIEPHIEISMTRQSFSTVHDAIENGPEQSWQQLLE